MNEPTLSVSWSSEYDARTTAGGHESVVSFWLNPYSNKLSAMIVVTAVRGDERNRFSYVAPVPHLNKRVFFKEWTDSKISDLHDVGEFSILHHHSPVWKNSSKWLARTVGGYEFERLLVSLNKWTTDFMHGANLTHQLLGNEIYRMRLELGLIERPKVDARHD